MYVVLGLMKDTPPLPGMNSSYHIRTNVNVRRVLFEKLVYMVYIMERHYLALVNTFKKAIKKFEINVYVQRGGKV